jgi:hypothetical protein
MKLFQIEEPDGGPADPDMPGAAIGIDASGAAVEVAFAVGGNADRLADRDGLAIAVPSPDAPVADWQSLFEAARMRGERALARPVTHVVVALAAAPPPAAASVIEAAAAAAGLGLLRLVAADGAAPALAAACLAEDLAPRG